ncbi:MAG: GWxTD domain-containing protein [bacterium]
MKQQRAHPYESRRGAGAALLVLSLLAGTLVPEGARGQDMLGPEGVGPEFHANVVTFQSERGAAETVVEVYLSVAYDQLAFTRAGEVFRADYELAMHLLGPRGETVFDERASGNTTTPVYEETLSEDVTRVQRFTFVVRPGLYELDVTLTDRNLGESRTLVLEVDVPAYPANRLTISDLLLADYLGESSPDLPPGAVIDRAGAQLFTRRGHSYIPNTRAVYANFAPSLLAYYEVYGFDPLRQTSTDARYKVEYYVENDSEETLLYYMRRHEKPGPETFNSLEMNIQDLSPGDYVLSIGVTDLGTGQTVSSSRGFRVLESYLTLAYRDYDKAVRQLRYIASERELRTLRQAEGEEERLRLFRQFWISRDPTPGTKRNEALTEYYRRIEYANEVFGVPQLEGWATDRGMVYITLGLPDHVERDDFTPGSKPVEVWVYNSMRLRLLFRDDTGFGDFTLVNRQEYLERVQMRRGGM